jgi:outer membrane protein TolC
MMTAFMTMYTRKVQIAPLFLLLASAVSQPAASGQPVQAPPGTSESTAAAAGRGTGQASPTTGENPSPQPGQQPSASPPGEISLGALNTPAGASLNITLEDALARARANAPQLLSANIAAQLAREDRVQARAALLPSLNWFNQFIYTQPNGTPSGVFVANDGPHIYNNQAIVHGDIFAPGKRADYQRTLAAEAVARARADIALRGLVAVVVQNYYGLVSAERKYRNAQQSLREAQDFLDLTRKQEQGGEVAHADVVKAEIQFVQRQRDSQEAQLAVDRSRIGFAVLLFPDFRRDYTVTDDLPTTPGLPRFDEVQTLAARNNPDIRAAQETVRQQTFEIKVARSALLPSLSFDYFYGINANQYAIYNRNHQNNLGSVAQAQMTVPVWTWGANRSRVRQAQLRLQQARTDLTFTQRQQLASLNAFYLEAQVASAQIASLKHSLDLSSDSLRLTILRYQSGEATALEVVDAQSTLTLARNALDDGLLRYRLALANLQTLTGTF